MNDTNVIDSCKASLPVQHASNIELISRSDTCVVIDSELHPSRMRKASLLFAPLGVSVHTDYSAFPMYTPTKPLIGFHIKYKTVLFPILYMLFIFYILIIKCKYMYKQ